MISPQHGGRHGQAETEAEARQAASRLLTTVDWSNWLNLTPAEQQALWQQYRAIIRRESDEARATNYRRMQDALWGRRHG